jgi:hypothetical protein
VSQSSCRPLRLIDFARTADAIGEGFISRAGRLDDFLDTYIHECEEPYRCDTTGTAETIRAWARSYQALGEWTTKVAQEFINACAPELLKHPLYGGADPSDLFKRAVGLPPGVASMLARDPGKMTCDDFELDISLPGVPRTLEFSHTGRPPRPDDPALKKFLVHLQVVNDVETAIHDGTRLGKWLGRMGVPLTVFGATAHERRRPRLADRGAERRPDRGQHGGVGAGHAGGWVVRSGCVTVRGRDGARGRLRRRQGRRGGRGRGAQVQAWRARLAGASQGPDESAERSHDVAPPSRLGGAVAPGRKQASDRAGTDVPRPVRREEIPPRSAHKHGARATLLVSKAGGPEMSAAPDTHGSPVVSVGVEPGWEQHALPDGGAALRPEAWDGPLSPQVIVQLLALPTPTSLGDYCKTDESLVGGGVLLDRAITAEPVPGMRVLLAHRGQSTGMTTLQRHDLLSDQMVLLASASCAACDWPALEPAMQRIVSSCHFDGDVPEPPARDVASAPDPVAPASAPIAPPPDSGLHAARFDTSGDLLDRLAQDVLDSRSRATNSRLRAELQTADLTADGVPAAPVVAAAMIRSDPAARFTLVSATTAVGRTLDGWVAELGVSTLVRPPTPTCIALATFTPVVGDAACVLAQAMGFRSRAVKRPAPATEGLLTWNELLAPFWSPGEPGWLSPDEADGIVLHHLLWSRSDAGADDELVLVALDAGARGWLTAVPADPVTGRYSVRPSSPPEIWRALCVCLQDLAGTGPAAGTCPPVASSPGDL